MMNPTQLLSLYRSMLLIRYTEEGISDRYREEGQRMRCPVHLCTGQEAAAVGVCAHLHTEDGLFGAHRSHGHYLAKGGDLQKFVDELYGMESGCCHGRGGSMHLIDRQAGFMGATPIVGDTIPLAVGAAWAGQRRGDGSLAVIFFGDGCFEEGVLHESMNFAALKGIPVLFVCENNNYAVYTQLKQRQPPRTIRGVAEAHGIPVLHADGNDIQAVWQVAGQAIDHIRQGKGPFFLELFTFRLREHCGPEDDDHLGYREPGELAGWLQQSPMERAVALLRQMGVGQEEITALEAEVKQSVDHAFAQAKQGQPAVAERASEGVFAAVQAVPPLAPEEGATHTLSVAQAIREATAQAMAIHSELFIIGEGVPDPKAIFGTTQNLLSEWGAERVLDMPLAENGMTGICIGAALRGMPVVMVHQRIDFLYLAMDQLANVAAKWHYLFAQSVPLVVRTLIGRGWGQGPQHGQSLQALFAHIPGIKVVMPVTAQDAKGMLLAAIADPNPVLFIEHRWLHTITGEVPTAPYQVSLQHARWARRGQHLTVAAFSYMVLEALRAAEVLASYGIELEVIDMRVVQPLDMSLVLESVQRTGYLLVADTGWQSFGVAAEVLARTAEAAFAALQAAPRRLALPDHPLPTAPSLTHDYYPDAESLVRTVLDMLQGKFKVNPEEVAARLHRHGHRDIPNAQFTGPF
ncbi:MAG: hypothetical protein HQM04_09390 [Magnetococcales bacterium]|nr:hypothetical protein [Magnetococcales bacterium]MBF0115246.1 hypothetical protein [Magnetococcales bacterium]